MYINLERVWDMLEVFTSTIRYSGEDRLDISIKSAGEVGRIFAPTWDMVMGTKEGRYTEEEYTTMYLELMRFSYRHYRTKWDRLLQKQRIVLLCYCKAGDFCHRRLLAEILVKLGAVYMEEI